VDSEIARLIPHRPPFLWLDRVLERSEETLMAQKFIPPDLDVFAGHYPGYPIMPGVLLCESVFQAGAVLIARGLDGGEEGVPVLTRIFGARFKRQVRPGDTITVHVRLKERMGPAWVLKGKAEVAGRTAVTVEFACALAPRESVGGAR